MGETGAEQLASMFGAAGDVTLDELVVESFFPGDEDTRRFVTRR